MPFRTRDFALFLFIVAFLVIGITSSLDISTKSDSQQASLLSLNENSESNNYYEATLPEAQPNSRPERLAELRSKISRMTLVSVPSEPEIALAAAEEMTDSAPTNGIDLCAGHQRFTTSWSPNNLSFEIVEGARILYRDVSPTSTTTGDVLSEREMVLQLPLSNYPHSEKSCLSMDVVGIALDGSLIRNSEYAMYRIFDSNSLLGYALDGFPIYGLRMSGGTDRCGGAIEGGEYGYYLSNEREGVLGCFAGAPASL